MATNIETPGDDRGQRIAELKRKMQENAKRVKAEQEEGQAKQEAPAAKVAAVATAEAPAAVAVAEATSANGASVAQPAPAAGPVATPSAVARPAAAAAPAPAVAATSVTEEEANSQAALTRREFLTYAWGAALGLLTVEAGLVSYLFMYPRFRAGEFGGRFFLPITEVPALESAPVAETAGKFWLVNSEDGPKALYMVCTHLGCLYKWEASNNRFECPCHGSKFSKEGFYIEGPAPRSLDEFDLAEENGQLVIDTGAKITGGPATESPARIVAS
jgi:cytochrome b6-f complex iron-sulfur subunit